MKKKIALFLLIIIFTYSLGGIIYIKLTKENTTPIITEIDSIEEYQYKLNSNASDYYKEEFEKLKENLKETKDEEEYIKSICKLYIIDLYTLDTKINKYDISTEFIYPQIIENYKLNLQDTLYKYLEEKTLNERKQELPIVSNVNIDKIEDSTYTLNDNKISSKKVSLNWTYEKDLGYETSGTITLIKQDNYYYIVEYK